MSYDSRHGLICTYYYQTVDTQGIYSLLLKIVLYENVMNPCWSLVSNSWNALTREKIGNLVTHLIQSVFQILPKVLGIIVCSHSSGVLNPQKLPDIP